MTILQLSRSQLGLVHSKLEGSEFRVHRQWFDQSAMAELLETDFVVAEKDRLYRCLDPIVEDKPGLFQYLRERWQDLFQAQFDVLLYDLTSTYIGAPGQAWRIQRVKFPPRQGASHPTGNRALGLWR